MRRPSVLSLLPLRVVFPGLAEACLLNQSSSSAATLVETKFTTIIEYIWSHFAVLLKSNLDV